MYRKKSPYGAFQLKDSIWADTYITHTVCAHMHFKVFNKSRLPTHSCRHLCCLVPPLHQSDSWWHFQHTHIKFSHIWCSDILFPHRCQSPPVRHKGKIKQITTSPVDSARPIRFFLTFYVFDIWMEKWLYQIPRCLTKMQQAKLSDCYRDPDLDYLTSKITWHTVELPRSFMYSWGKATTEGGGGREKLTGLMKSSPSWSHSIEAAWIPPGMLPLSLSVSLM